MKKILIILFMLFVPVLVNAEACQVTSGTGNEIGDEITCGTESFYIIDNSKNIIKAMTKYNLMTKVKCELYLFENSYTPDQYGGIPGAYEEFMNAYRDKLTDDKYDFAYKSDDNGDVYGVKVCYFDNTITDNTIKQDEKAIAYQEKNNELNFPFYGLSDGEFLKEEYQRIYDDYEDVHYGNKSNREYEEYNHFIDFKMYYNSLELDSYTDYLEDNGFEVGKIDLLSLNEFNDLIEKVSGEKLDLVKLSNKENWIYRDNTKFITPHYILKDLKDTIPEKYKWIYGTSYLLKTIYFYNNMDFYDQLFVLSTGDLCAYNINLCGGASYIAGLRPIVTFSKDDIGYNIKTKTDNNGSIKVSEYALESESIVFEIVPDDGYSISKLVITDSKGNKIEYDKNYKFIMPASDVLIEVEFSDAVNPNTSTSFIQLGVVIICIISCILFIRSKRKMYYY
ncbi:MAG: hypothetical protein IKH54_07425 [Bacilli bacterium]|nr:hypothetical protein [Bacilli bacterium]